MLALGDRPGDKWLEPGVGKGVFLQALADQGVERARITAIDLDPEQGPADSLARIYRGNDFIAWSLKTHYQFDRIVGNPPYVALKKLPSSLRDIAASVPGPGGNSIGVNSNYWHAFFCASLRLLRRGGGLSFVLPAAWDFATYAFGLRNFLNENFARIETHRTQKPIFAEVQEGCIVVVADGFGERNTASVKFFHRTMEELIDALHSSRCRATKTVSHKQELIEARNGEIRVGNVLEIRLGGVTGDADFFLLTETERCKKELPLSSLRPVLTKARHLTGAEITKQSWTILRKTNERVWLFYPGPRVLRHPSVQRYLELDVAQGGCRRERYKVKIRAPWYLTPLPRRIDGFISGMSGFGPWVSLKNMKGLTATNTLYTVHFKKTQTPAQKAAWALSFLTSYTRQAATALSRIYADGLVKYEPGDLRNLPLLVPKKCEDARELYSAAVRLLRDGHKEKAREIADNYIA